MHGIKHSRSQALIDYAYAFAKSAHEGQVRKYTGEPYINHPVEVARIVAGVTDDCECICAALLHDTVEDCGVTKDQLVKEFGYSIAEMVMQLSDVSRPEDGNRTIRKRIDCEHTAKAWPKTKTVKLADLISNTSSICEHDKDFARVYLKEKCALIKVLTDGDKSLLAKCKEILISNGYEVD